MTQSSPSPTKKAGRNILVAIDLSDQSLMAMQWAAYEFYRPGDTIHICHVSRILSPQVTIQHNYPGASFTVPDPHPIDEREHAQQVTEVIKSRFTSILDCLHIPHSLHLFLDTDNAPASAVCATLFKVADQCQAAILVLACHNKAYGWTEFLLGSVAEYAVNNCKVPLMVVKSYKQPAASSGNATTHASPKTLVIPTSSPRMSPAASPSDAPRDRSHLHQA